MTLASVLLQRAVDERNAYRAVACAALDQLHEQARIIDRLREELREIKDLQRRMACEVFHL